MLHCLQNNIFLCDLKRKRKMIVFRKMSTRLYKNISNRTGPIFTSRDDMFCVFQFISLKNELPPPSRPLVVQYY